jgi:hypothetical protein
MDFQQPNPQPVGPAASTWTQDVPVGGEDVLNDTAKVAVAVSPQGIQTVRNVPAMRAAAMSYDVAAASSTRILGQVPQRRAVTIIATVAGYLNVEQGLSQSGQGLPVPANTPIVLQSAGEVWFYASTAGEVGYWSEIDLG